MIRFIEIVQRLGKQGAQIDRLAAAITRARRRCVFLSIFLFHLANAPTLPTVALYVKKLGGSDYWMTATILTAQVVMVPVALLAGRYCDA
jgi:hypothetical protein